MAGMILAGLAIATIIYNTIVTHITMKNEICHLKDEIENNREGIKRIEQWIFNQKK